VEDVHWFLGTQCAPVFLQRHHNRRNAPNYAQGIVQLGDTTDLRQTIRDLQRR
jgi:hypothetical protein